MSDSDEEGGDHDAYLERMKREGKDRDEDDSDDSSGKQICLVVDPFITEEVLNESMAG